MLSSGIGELGFFLKYCYGHTNLYKFNVLNQF